MARNKREVSLKNLGAVGQSIDKGLRVFGGNRKGMERKN